jgi:hypothetical protein
MTRQPPTCGTRSGYVRGCRCPACRSANAAYQRSHKAGRIDAGTAGSSDGWQPRRFAELVNLRADLRGW